MEPLVTNDLSNDFDTAKGQIVDNFVKIQQWAKDGTIDQATIEVFQGKLNQLSSDSEIRDANMHKIVRILADYNVPIAIVDGEVVETEEGE